MNYQCYDTAPVVPPDFVPNSPSTGNITNNRDNDGSKTPSLVGGSVGGQTQSIGGTQIYCSSPSAPGWHTDIPGGGCGGNISTTSSQLGAGTTTIHLNQLPVTGAPLFDTPLVACLLAAFITTCVITYIRSVQGV